MKKNAVAERFKAIRLALKKSQKELANELGVSDGYISHIENGRDTGASIMFELNRRYGVSVDYLISGQGTQFVKHLDSFEVKPHVKDDVKNHQNLHSGIPLVGQPVQAGYLVGYADPEYLDELPRLVLPGLPMDNSEDWLAFEVRGDSMHPTLSAEDIVVCELLQEPSQLRSGRVYVVVTRTEGIVVKRVYAAPQGLLLKSDNPTVATCTLPFEDLVQIWEVRRRITAALEVSDAVPLIHELENRMEARLRALESGLKS
jgi:transcriptional regulator with XRE-family HTH domain